MRFDGVKAEGIQLSSEGADFNLNREREVYKCPKCGSRMNRFKRWVLIKRSEGKIIFRKLVRPVGNVLLNKYVCPNCKWEGTAWDVLKGRNLTMYGTRKRKKGLERYPFELVSKAKPHPPEFDRH